MGLAQLVRARNRGAHGEREEDAAAHAKEPASGAALYSRALDAILRDASDERARGIGASARLQRRVLRDESARALLRRLAVKAHTAHAVFIEARLQM